MKLTLAASVLTATFLTTFVNMSEIPSDLGENLPKPIEQDSEINQIILIFIKIVNTHKKQTLVSPQVTQKTDTPPITETTQKPQENDTPIKSINAQNTLESETIYTETIKKDIVDEQEESQQPKDCPTGFLTGIVIAWYIKGGLAMGLIVIAYFLYTCCMQEDYKFEKNAYIKNGYLQPTTMKPPTVEPPKPFEFEVPFLDNDSSNHVFTRDQFYEDTLENLRTSLGINTPRFPGPLDGPGPRANVQRQPRRGPRSKRVREP